MNDPADQLAAGLDPALLSTAPLARAWTPPAPEALAGIFPQLEIIALIGQGGMGAVYRARQVHLDRPVAVKILAPERSEDAAFAERFAREARALARLQHPNIVTLFDFGQAGPWLYLVMEHVEGANLRQVLATGRLSSAATLDLVAPLCAAVAHAHAQGVVHRDLKPENILIDGLGRPKIADFGLAKLGGADDSLTRTGDGLGTPHYMAPEQVAGAAEVDHRADIYALGVVIYELLTGSLPLGRCALPSDSGSDPRLDEVVLKSLERDPGRRWQSAEALGRALAGAQTAPAPAAGTATHPGEGSTPPGAPPTGLGDAGPAAASSGKEGVRATWKWRSGKRRDDGADADGGYRKLFSSGMTMLVGGTLLAAWLFADTSGAEGATSLRELAQLANVVVILGGLSLLLRTALPLGLAGAIASLLVIPWCWHWHWALGMGVVIAAMAGLERVFDIRRLSRHYASLPWRSKILRALTLACLAIGIGWFAYEFRLKARDSRAGESAALRVTAGVPIPWDAAHLPPGCRLDAEDILVVEATAARRILLPIRAVSLTSRRYRIHARVRWHAVEGSAFLELWSHFSAGADYFFRTPADDGPNFHFSGSSATWRETWLPCDARGAVQNPSGLEVWLVMPGAGTVELSPLEYIDDG